MKNKPTYQELKNELEHLKKTNILIEKSPIVRFLWKNDENWPVEYVSENVKNIFEYSAKDFISEKIVYSEIIHPSDLQIVKKEVEKYSKEKKHSIKHKPYRIVTKSGKIKWINDITLIRRNHKNEITHYEGIIFDITEQKNNELKLKKLIAAVEQSASIIVITDIDGKIEYVNKKFVKTTGYSIPEVIGQNPKFLNAGKQPKEYYAKMWNVIKTGKKWKGEFCNKTKKGEIYWEKATIAPIKDDNNNIINFIGIKEDVTLRKKAERALKSSEEKYRNIIDNMHDIYYRADAEGRFVMGSRSVAKTLGYSNMDNAVGTKIASIYKNPNERMNFLKLLKKDGYVKNFHTSLLKKDGSEIFVETTAKILLDKNGKYIGVEGIVRDITERKKAEKALKESEKKLKESNRTKDKFFSIIAHDLRSPFNAMLGFSDILLANHKEYSSEKREFIIKSIRSSADKAFNLLDNLLTWSRAQLNRMEYLPQKLNLSTLLFEALFDLQQQADKKQIQIFDTIYKSEFIFADKNMIAVILRNIISNAIKFTQKKGSILIASEKDKNSDFAVISVIDTGIGIPEDKINNLFRIDKTESTQGTENEKGTGLGLIICKEFVERHGGKIWIKSEIDKGTTFFFTVPYNKN